MKSVKVKICGITNKDDLLYSISSGADALGFVCGFKDSKRNLDLNKAEELSNLVPPFVYKVVVTPIDDSAFLQKVIDKIEPNALQLYGYSGKIPSIDRKGVKLINAINLDQYSMSANDFSKHFDAIVLDSISNGMGGTGITHNWSRSNEIRKIVEPTPLILAGGLTPTNVSDAINIVQPFAVDVSTGVEKEPGKKDHSKIKLFINESKRGL